MSKSRVIQSKNIVISTQCFHKKGGIENIIQNLALEFTRKNYKVTIFADVSSKINISGKTYLSKIFKLYNYGGIKFLRKLRKNFAIKKFLKSNNVSNIFFDTWKSAEPFFKLNSNSNIQIICLAHGNDVLDQGNLNKKRRICNTLKKIDRIIANSHFTKEKIKSLGLDVSKVIVIHPGIDTDIKFLKPKKFYSQTLVTIARLEKRKNHINVIKAVDELSKEEFPDIRYFIYGTGPELNSIENIISETNNKKILLMPVAENAKTDLPIGDIFIMPTIEDKKSFSIEGFGIAYIEAAFFGIPSISSGIGGTNESVIHNKTGLICDGNNIQSIKASIKELLDNKKKYERLSKNAKKFASSFLWDKKINSYIKLLKN